jgi:UDP-N-acetylmuramate dehydrogenase
LKSKKLLKINAYKIFNIVCQTRKKKLPDPKKLGNAGSFFKNPIITFKKAEKILSSYINVPHYIQNNGFVKISAAWLIEKYNFKNIQIGNAAIYKKQKLILINLKNANSKEILTLAKKIQTCILKKFEIYLEPEVDFINSSGRIKLL